MGTPSSRRVGPAWRMAGWKRGAKQKPMPASSTQRATPSGPRSITTPSASSTSAVPQLDEAARLPCLQTFAPAPATTSAASVDTLMVWARSPPVPTMSIDRGRIGQRDDLGHGEHGADQAGQLVDRLPLHPQGDDEAGDLRGRGGTVEDLGHGRAGLLRR